MVNRDPDVTGIAAFWPIARKMGAVRAWLLREEFRRLGREILRLGEAIYRRGLVPVWERIKTGASR